MVNKKIYIFIPWDWRVGKWPATAGGYEYEGTRGKKYLFSGWGNKLNSPQGGMGINDLWHLHIP